MVTLIAMLVMLGILIFLLYTIWTYIQNIRLSWKLFKRQNEMKERAERMGADAILYRYAKDGKIPSWAYEQTVKELKAYCKRAEQLNYTLYMADQKLETIPMDPVFRYNPNTPFEEQKLLFATWIRDFDLETYGRTGKPTSRDQEKMNEMAKVWYFVDPHCGTMEQAETNIRILARSVIPEEWRKAGPLYNNVASEEKRGGPRYKERT